MLGRQCPTVLVLQYRAGSQTVLQYRAAASAVGNRDGSSRVEVRRVEGAKTHSERELNRLHGRHVPVRDVRVKRSRNLSNRKGRAVKLGL